MPKIVMKKIRIRPTTAHRHKKAWHVKGHEMRTRSGKIVYVRPHIARAHEKVYREKGKTIKRPELRYGGHFNEVAQKIAKEYEKKGYSKKEAEEIGKKTAGNVYRYKLAKDYKRR